MNDSRIPKIVYEWELEGKIHRGQLLMYWEQGTHPIMRNLDIRTRDAQDRDR